MTVDSKTYASDCKILSIALHKASEDDKVHVNLIQMAGGFQYFEDITCPAYAGNITVVDNEENLISNMPLQGFEKLVFKVSIKNGDGTTETTYEYPFRVWKILNRVVKDRRNVYSLALISDDGLINEGLRVNRILEGTPTQVVEKLLDDYLNKGSTGIPFDSEDSDGKIKMLPAKKTPFSIIRSIQHKCIPVKKSSVKTVGLEVQPFQGESYVSQTSDVDATNKAKGTAGFLFFRTYRGYVFKSIDTLCEVGENTPSKVVSGSASPVTFSNEKDYFRYSAAKVENDGDERKIQEVVFEAQLDIMEKMRDGAYSSIVSFFNINTFEYDEQVYSLSDVWDDMVHLGSQTKLPVGQTKLSKYPTRVMSTVINNESWYSGSGPAENDSDVKDLQKSYLAQSIARFGILSNQKLTISLTGHLELCAGDKIEVRIPNQVTDEKRTETDTWDPEHSGTYLISKLNHQFDIPNQTVYTVLDLIRDSYGIRDKESKTQ